MQYIRLLLLFWGLSLSYHTYAQLRWEIGVVGGATAYAGDLNESDLYDFKMARPAAGLFLRRNLHPNIALRFNLLGGEIAGDEKHFTDPFWRKERAFKFTSRFLETGLQLEWDLRAHRRIDGIRFRRTWSPYFFAGPALLYYRPVTDYNDIAEPNPSVHADRIEADRALAGLHKQWIVQVGGGWKWDLGRNTMIGMEIGMRPTFQDYLDGVQISGNPLNDDWYLFGGITLTRRLYGRDSDRDWIPNRRDHCPLVAGPRKLHGCPDADADGITDAEDACPEAAGPETACGCPDIDFDGITDSVDLCPKDFGVFTAGGCPDQDLDGVEDILDCCPESAGLPMLEGCPDSDLDGIADIFDLCPLEGGRINKAGCPDADGDGLADVEDRCPSQFGLASFQGCPDADGDGVEDALDFCPYVPGLAAFEGCPDTDKDGVEDIMDLCPDRAGDAAYFGCPDTDGDGLNDLVDRCPLVAGPLKEKGCPEISKEDKKALDLAVRNIEFETGSDILKPESLPVLNQVAEILDRYANYKVHIGGHTDNVGKAKANQKLSEKRAQACLQYLTQHGIAADRLSAKGYGHTKPVSTNKTPAGRQKNRRVEFGLKKW